MKSPEKVRDLVLKTVPLLSVMQDYGVDFIYDPNYLSEVQFRCPFHGKDNKPSARLYKETQTCWCWVCHKKWDVIRFVQDKENIPPAIAVKRLVKKYQVDLSSIPDDPELKREVPTISLLNIRMDLVRRRLLSLRGRIKLEKYAPLSVAYLMLVRDVSLKADVSIVLKKFEDKMTLIEKD